MKTTLKFTFFLIVAVCLCIAAFTTETTVYLEAGEEKDIVFPLQDRFSSVYDEELGDFRKIGGEYELYAGGCSRDLPLCAKTVRGKPLNSSNAG